MSDTDKDKLGGVLTWGQMALTVAVMVGAVGLSLLLIPPLSLNAAVKGGLISIGAFLGVQVTRRLVLLRRK